MPILVGSLALAANCRPRFSLSHRRVDVALWICLAIIGLQLIPLQPSLRLWLSPASAAADRALFLNRAIDPRMGPPRPLSLDPVSTMWALLVGAAVLMIFWSARAMFEQRSALRVASRGVVWFGFIMSIVAFVQHATTPRLIYGFWKPITQTSVPLPYGPFVSRNDLATWLILAIPLGAGYCMARFKSARVDRPTNIEDVIDARTVWLIVALGLMIALLLASTSRSGITGCAAGLLAFVALARRRVSGRQFLWLLIGIAAVGLGATAYVNLPALAARFGDVLGPDLGRGRLTIWRSTWPIARDFLWTGIGVGAFERGMLVYQESPRLLFFNHAHDEYLQFLVEGGLPLVCAAGLTLLAAWREIASRLRTDHTSVFWIRAGAAAGIVGVAVQSLWDTGLRMPANEVMFAIVAAVALHEK